MIRRNETCAHRDVEFQDGNVNVQSSFVKYVVAGLVLAGELVDFKTAVLELESSPLHLNPMFFDIFRDVSQIHSLVTTIEQVGSAVFKTLAFAIGGAFTGSFVQSQALWIDLISTAPSAAALGNLFVVVKFTLAEIRKERQLTADWEAASGFARALYVKSTCVSDRFKLDDMDTRALKPALVDTCGDDGVSRLSSVLKRSHAAVLKLFSAIGLIGKCLYAKGNEDVFNEKVKCSIALKSALYRFRRQEGILLQGLKVAEVYGAVADELLLEPYYGRTLHNIAKLGDSFHSASGMFTFNVPDEIEGRESRERFKAVTCLSLTAALHGFGETLHKIAKSVDVWMRSYARELGSYIGRSPCRKVLRTLSDPRKGFCNHEPDMPPLVNSCAAALTEPIWDRDGHTKLGFR
eukprot:TRINITY_DN66058_c0_g1_i1.p1 TRINITY_DN66058_c0_g1~~TRINITY_DN66058_c0_g1_i1.p1  ORF type:complete len:452 (-),score=31.43 TRINITY_DN66058_c0_g1_i1:59-1276(-)